MVDEAIVNRISIATTAKWALDFFFQYKEMTKSRWCAYRLCWSQFVMLKMNESKTIEDFFNHAISIVNQLRLNSYNLEDQRTVEWILRTLTLGNLSLDCCYWRVQRLDFLISGEIIVVITITWTTEEAIQSWFYWTSISSTSFS